MAQKTKEKTEPKTPPKEPESKEKRRGPGRPPERKPQLKDETRHTVIGVIFLALAIFFIIAGFGHGGIAGHATKSLLGMLFGVGYALAPLLLGSVGITFMRSGKPEIAVTQAIGSALFLIGSLGLIDVATSTAHSAGFLGRIVAYPFVALFDTLAATLFLGAALIISIVILFDTRPTMTIFASAWASIQKFFAGLFASKKGTEEITLSGMTSADEVSHTEVVPPTAPEPEPIPEQKAVPIETTDEADIAPIAKTKKKRSNYIAPLLEMLESDRGKPNTGDVKANANIIKRTLANFGIEVEMDEVTIGPTVTRYAFKPAEGVKLSRILALQNDLALALAAHPLRIEAPIP
jgi:S-DNA-T family DNA segregation ATPase FtsK/SpoIIIE